MKRWLKVQTTLPTYFNDLHAYNGNAQSMAKRVPNVSNHPMPKQHEAVSWFSLKAKEAVTSLAFRRSSSRCSRSDADITRQLQFARYALRRDWAKKRAHCRNRARESDIRRKANDELASWREIRWDIAIAWLLFAREMCREVACLGVDLRMYTHIKNGATQSQSDTCKSA